MQPYFFPYIGYFHLIKSVDRFIIYDDVNYINRGWINRNRIPINGKATFFTIPLNGASQNININLINIIEDDFWKKKMLKTFKTVYAKSPFKLQGMEILEKVITIESKKLVNYCIKSITEVLSYLDLRTEIISTSMIYNNSNLKADERIIDICLKEQARSYFNLAGGRGLYHPDKFNKIGCELNFIESRLSTYMSSAKPFIPGLSILDIIMNCGKDQIQEMMHQYRIVNSLISDFYERN